MLLRRKDSAAVPAIAGLLADEDRSLRVSAAQALGVFADRSAVEALISALFKEKFWDVRSEIVEALRLIGDPAAVNELILLLESNKDDLGLQQFTAWALKRFGWEQLSGEQQATVCILRDEWASIDSIGSAAVKPLVNAIKHGTHHVRRTAAESLGKIGDDRCIAALVELFDDPDEKIRQACAEVTEKVARQRDDTRLRAKALIALGRWPAISALGAGAIDVVLEACQTSDQQTRQQAIRALGSVATARAVTALVQYLRAKDVFIRRAAADGLERAASPEATQPLVLALDDDDDKVRQSAARALKKIGWKPTNQEQHIRLAIAAGAWSEAAQLGQQAAKPLIKAFENATHRAKVMGALVELGAHAVEPLVELLKTESESEATSALRLSAVEALGKIGHRKAIPALEQVMDDPELFIRRGAVEALERLGWKPTTLLAQADVAIAIEDWSRLLEIGAPCMPRLMGLLRDDTRAGQSCLVIEKLLAGDAVSHVPPDQLHALAGLVTSPTRAGGIQGRHAVGGKKLNATVAKRRVSQLARAELKRRKVSV